MQIKCVSKKTTIIIGHQHDYWRELKEALRVHTCIYIQFPFEKLGILPKKKKKQQQQKQTRDLLPIACIKQNIFFHIITYIGSVIV